MCYFYFLDKIMSAGRPADPIWQCYIRRSISGVSKAECKSCNHILAANAQRLKNHYEKHHEEENARRDGPTQPKISKFVTTTTKEDQQRFDKSVGRFFFANNIPFAASESAQFKKLCQDLHPGYLSPTRRKVANEILDECHEELVAECSSKLAGKEVAFCVDGWSNVSQESIIASSIQYNGLVYIVGTTDATSVVHTSENIAEITMEHIKDAETKYAVKVSALITDNAENMSKMRKIVGNDLNVIEYGCAAHQINLVAKDLVPSAIVSKVTEVAKLFRNCHLPHAWLQSEGASKPPMPSAVRWNSVARLVEWYVDE